MPEIEAFVVDYDGVLRLWPGRRVAAIEAACTLPAGAIEAAAFGSAVFRPMLLGDVCRTAWYDDVERALGASFHHNGRRAAARWARLRGELDEPMLAVIRALRRWYPVALLSNADRALRADLAAVGLADGFDVVAVSAETGLVKPDPMAFLQVAGLLGRPPRACLVIDDSSANVAAARSVGMAAVLHRSARGTRRAIGRLLTAEEVSMPSTPGRRRPGTPRVAVPLPRARHVVEQ